MPLDGTPDRLPPRRGLMLILSSPSGAGKTTLTRMLLQKEDIDLTLSVSVTTRPRRIERGRRHPLPFHHAQTVRRAAGSGELLEWAEVHGNFYGTPRAPVGCAAARRPRRAVRHRLPGHPADPAQGARRVATIFILPPSMRELRARLERRAEDKRRGDRAPPDGGPQRDHPLDASTITCWSTTTCSGPSATCVAILAAERLRRLRTEPVDRGLRRAILASEG